MADPFSITANAVGVISLGITVCQGLVNYCQAYAAQYDDVRLALRDLQDLEKSLLSLSGTLTVSGSQRPASLILLPPLITRLNTLNEELQSVLKELGKDVLTQDSLKRKMKSVAQRTLYPFKRGLIDRLRDTVHQARDNLALALAVVQVEMLTGIANFGDNISKLVQQNAFAQTSFVDLSRDIQQLKSDLISRPNPTPQLHPPPLDAHAQSGRFIDVGIAPPNVASSQSTPHATVLGPSMENLVLDDRKLAISRRCICAKISLRRTRGLSLGTWNLSQTESTMTRHVETCPYWNASQKSSTTTLSISHVNLLFSRALYLSISMSKQAGAINISPYLSLRGMINKSSPASTLLRQLKSQAEYPYPHRPTEPKPGEILKSANLSILKWLKEGRVSPHEVDESGKTMLHQVLSCYRSRFRLDENLKPFQELLQTLLDAGIAINEINLRGATALDEAVSTINGCYSVFSPSRQSDSIYGFLARHGAEFSGSFFSVPANDWNVRTEFENLATLEPWLEAAEYGPLSLAILRRNEQDVVRILRAKPSSIHEMNRRQQNPLHLACCWPRGIELLLDAGAGHLVHQTDACDSLPITYCLQFKSEDGVILLLNADSALVSSPRDMFNFFWWLFYSEEQKMSSSVINAIQDRRQRLFYLAQSTMATETWAKLGLPNDRLLDARATEVQRMLVEEGVEVPSSIFVPERWETVYHLPVHYFNFNLERALRRADELWDIGFKDIDSFDATGKTPLMITRSLSYVQWLLDHGADPRRERHQSRWSTNEVAGFTASHYIARNFAWEILRGISEDKSMPLLDESSPLFREILLSTRARDNCNCACSADGCTPLSTLMAVFHNHRSLDTEKKAMRVVIQYLESPYRNDASSFLQPKMFEEIVRFETFEALQLRHTCYKSTYPGQVSRYRPEEVEEIHEEEDETLQRLEDLVTEFCLQFEEYEGNIASFLDDYWETRMEAVLKDVQDLDEESKRKLREIGVLIKEIPESSQNESEDELEMDDK